jgi:hypothetical protein
LLYVATNGEISACKTRLAKPERQKACSVLIRYILIIRKYLLIYITYLTDWHAKILKFWHISWISSANLLHVPLAEILTLLGMQRILKLQHVRWESSKTLLPGLFGWKFGII